MGEEDTQESATIYQLRASMNKKLSPQSCQESSSPEAAQELRNLLRRLVEIDVESRELLKRVSSLLEKDERLEHYMKERIVDPKASRMWQLIEQVLACQEQEHSDLDELVAKGGTGNPSATDKALKGNAIAETKPDRFKVKNLISNGGEEGTKTTGAPTTTTTTTSDEKSKGN